MLAGLAVALWMGVPSAVQAAVTFSPTYGGEGYGQRVRPKRMHGGSDFGWVKMRWPVWNRRSAKGRGIYYRDCKYDNRVCPGKRVRFRFRIKAHLYRPRACSGGTRFTRMLMIYKGRRVTYYSPPGRLIIRHGCNPGGAHRRLQPVPRSRHASPRITRWWIPFGAKRKRQMAAYSKRHYGKGEWRLSRPRVIVEHIAVAPTVSSIWSTFASGRPDPELGERPNVCAHFAVSSRGRVFQLVGLNKRCRHTVGLNHTAIGIEHVGYSDRDLLGNRRALRASLRLTGWLRCRFGIRIRNVIGHNESLRSPYHRERISRLKRQTHGDMRRSSMTRYRKLLRRAGRCRA